MPRPPARHDRITAHAATTPVRAAEPAGLDAAEPLPETRDEPALSAVDDVRWTGQLIAELTAQRRELARQFAERKRQLFPAGNSAHLGPAVPAQTGEVQDTVLQPPTAPLP